MADTQPTDELASRLRRTEVQHQPSSIPGREIVQVLTEIPAGVESGWHMHPGEEVGYILAGHVQMMIEGLRRPSSCVLVTGSSSRRVRRTTRLDRRPGDRADAVHLHRRGRANPWPR